MSATFVSSPSVQTLRQFIPKGHMWDVALRDTVGEHIKGLLVEQEKYYRVNEPTWSFTECRTVLN